ncbi:unnamed protein product [Onchocerca flexuosa]|uniref:Secreted protein n=1 Tax=Onchocerca flexuosa TaxID=387005 RepID=A0A183H408_9BILA|nr:unnamed protein product [Onchocerca flexuosa]
MGKIWNASRICVSSLRRGHANLLCIVPILVYVHRNEQLSPFAILYMHYRSICIQSKVGWKEQIKKIALAGRARS